MEHPGLDEIMQLSTRPWRILCGVLGKPAFTFVLPAEVAALSPEIVLAAQGAGRATVDEITRELRRHDIDWR